ncbi:MAG TPA: DUF58 domain-containing protein [Microbacterium sp.]|nr:DUF58 domain-containing protein [Microbacterium sp.]
MFVTGRLAALVGAGVAPIILLSLAAGGPGASDASGRVAWSGVAGWLVLCVVLTAADVSASADPRAIRVERDLPARARLGVPVQGTITVAATGRRRLRGFLRDGWEPTAGADPARLRLDIPPGESRTLPMTFLPRRRGERRTAFVAVRSIGPLGLAGRQTVTSAPAAIRVLPPFTASRHLPSRLARLRELDGSTSVQVRGQGTEFDSLREYVRGDDVRSIDWRATARARTTMLRTWRPERDRHVVIVIDTGRTSAARVGEGTRLDAAMESALLLAALADRAGDNVHLLMFDRVVRARVSGVRGARLLPALVDAMAQVEPQLIDMDWDAAFAQAGRLASHPSLVVLLTALDAPSASRALLTRVPTVTARGRVLLGAVTDVLLEQTAAKRDRSDQLWLAAAAERSLLDARRLTQALTHLGAEAILRGPDDLPPQIADRYLELKAAGRL